MTDRAFTASNKQKRKNSPQSYSAFDLSLVPSLITQDLSQYGVGNFEGQGMTGSPDILS